MLVEVFEHEKIRVGDPLRTRGAGSACFEPHHFDALVRFNDAHGGKYFEVGHQRITFAQYVGYLEVGDLAIEILPKADAARARDGEAHAWRDGLLEMLRATGDLELESPTAASQETGRSSLLDLLVLQFLTEVARLLRPGLTKGYRDEEQNGPTFRGRLVVAPHLRENIVRADRFYVRTQTYDREIVINRILRAALDALDGLALSPPTASRAATTRAAFPDIAPIRPTAQLFDRIRFSRSTTRYRRALVLAQMLLQRMAPTLRSGAVEVFALLFDMNILWERYIASVIRRVAPRDLAVSTQESRLFWQAESRCARTVRPDIVIRSRTTRDVLLIVDTKWKVLRNASPADNDLRQMFVYNELFAGPRSILLYPSTRVPGTAQGRYADRAHGCATAEIGVIEDRGWNTRAVAAQVEVLLALATGGLRPAGELH